MSMQSTTSTPARVDGVRDGVAVGQIGTTGARPGAMGFLTDTTLCIGCKACEVACKQWNQLPMDDLRFLASSYDNTRDLGATTWRHVAFVERLDGPGGQAPTELPP